MARTIKIKKAQGIPEDIEGCRLVPIDQGKPHFPKVQDNVLANTYYRVPIDDEDRLRAMVTVMPDGLRAAWDTCGKCHGHISQCRCKSGVYHPSSIGWMRATFEHPEWPDKKILDYSEFFDPFKRREGNELPRWDEVPGSRMKVDSPKPKAKPKVQPQAPVEDGGLTVKDIENIDMAELNKQAKSQAKRTIRRTRSILRGGK